MSFYSYKNANPKCCPGLIGHEPLSGLTERVCVQVKRVYDSGLLQEQLKNTDVTLNNYAVVPQGTCTCAGQCCPGDLPNPVEPVVPITFESCRSASTQGNLRNLTIERLCDRPCFARVRGTVDVPIDILFSDSRCVQYIGQATISQGIDVLLSIPDEAIVPYCIESMCSAICVSGTYRGDNVFRLTICLTCAVKVIAEVEILVPSYGFCTIPPGEEFAENVCDEFFSLPLYPPAYCEENNVQGCGVPYAANNCNRGTCNNWGGNCGNTCGNGCMNNGNTCGCGLR